MTMKQSQKSLILACITFCIASLQKTINDSQTFEPIRELAGQKRNELELLQHDVEATPITDYLDPSDNEDEPNDNVEDSYQETFGADAYDNSLKSDEERESMSNELNRLFSQEPLLREEEL